MYNKVELCGMNTAQLPVLTEAEKRELLARVRTGDAAARERMLGATIYMVCISPDDGSVVGGTSSCMMCKRQIINAGIATVIVRDTKEEYRVIDVNDWIENDDSLTGQFGY